MKTTAIEWLIHARTELEGDSPRAESVAREARTELAALKENERLRNERLRKALEGIASWVSDTHPDDMPCHFPYRTLYAALGQEEDQPPVKEKEI